MKTTAAAIAAALTATIHSAAVEPGRRWPLESLTPNDMIVHGQMSAGKGVKNQCLVLDGQSCLEVQESAG